MLVLEQAGLDHYSQPTQLLDVFNRMQDFQLKCAAEPNRTGYRRRPYKDPAERSRIRAERIHGNNGFLPIGETLSYPKEECLPAKHANDVKSNIGEKGRTVD